MNLQKDLLVRGEHEDTMGTSVYSSKDSQSMHKSLNGEFILYQLLMERLLDENTELPQSKSGIARYFKPESVADRNVMNEFDTEYKSEKAIHWYTRETCVYKLLNKALRTHNINDVTAFAKLVRDLYQQLKHEHKEFSKHQKSSILTVYRGQFLSKDELTRLKSAKGELFAMNSFLSTSSNKNKAIEFATSRSPPTDQLTSILLEIQVNIKSESRPLADIKHLSAFVEEEEILFMFGCVFRLDDVWFDEETQLWKLRLTLCGDADLDMKDFLSTLDEELEGTNRLISLGSYLFQMQKYKEAEEHYQKILDNKLITDPIELAQCYHGLSYVNEKKMDYPVAIQNLQQALELLFKNCPKHDHSLISKCYNDLGAIYTKQEQYQLAFESYDKALKTANSVPPATFSGLSQLHFQLQNYNISLRYLKQALKHQPTNAYASITRNYIDLGNLYVKLNDKEQAMKMFNKAIETQVKVLGTEHPDVSYTYTAMAMMHSELNDQDVALELMDKAYQIQLNSLPNNHSDFADTYRHYGDIYMKLNNINQALSYYHKALDNQLKTLSWNHPSVAIICITIGNAYRKMKDYKQALTYFHKVLDSELTRKNFGDPSLSQAYKTLGDVYLDTNDTDQCLNYYLQYLQNELQTKLHEHMSLAETYHIVAKIYFKKRLLSEALLYYNRLLDCYLQKKPRNEVKIKETYTKIGQVYLKKHRVDERLTYYAEDKTKFTNDFNSISNIHFEKRHLDQVLNYFQKFLNEQLKTSPRNDRLIAQTYRILGNIYYEKGDLDRALTSFEHLLAFKFKRKYLEHSKLSKIYRAIGTICLDKNRLDQALIFFNRFLDCRLLKKRSQDDPSVTEAYNLIGKVYLAKHDFNQTFSLLNKSIHNYRQTHVNSQSRILPNLTSYQYEMYHLDQSLFFYQNLLEKNFKNISTKPFSLEDIYAILGNMFLEKEDSYHSLQYFQLLLKYQLRKSTRGSLLIANTSAIIGNIESRYGYTYFGLENYRYALSIYRRINPMNQTVIDKLSYLIRQLLVPQI
ncbi:unnamed protein product [Adineta ricciae]|uniref:Nephrocystin-3 n=1 Tax=Adineta ricciae TaxID=249248 RepID=A0A815WWU3_ADIRI|nr:unnamed protein product [Adineta ricciae]